MPKSMKNMLLLAKAQPTIDVDPVPTAALNAMLVRSMGPTIIKAEFVKRNLLRGYKGNFASLAVGVHRMIECEVELAGSGAAGTAPKWAPLLMACDFSETLLAATSATYQPVANGSLATLYGYVDDVMFKMTNCKGSVSFELNSKNIPVMKYRFLGEYSTITDATNPTGQVFTGFQKPLTVGKANTPTFTAFGYSPVVQNFSFDVANALSYRELIGAAGPYVADRMPTGSATVEMPLVSAANFGELVRLGSETALNVTHGTTAGNIVTVSLPKVQLTSEPTISNDNEVAMVGLQYSVNPNAGNDEIVLVVR